MKILNLRPRDIGAWLANGLCRGPHDGRGHCLRPRGCDVGHSSCSPWDVVGGGWGHHCAGGDSPRGVRHRPHRGSTTASPWALRRQVKGWWGGRRARDQSHCLAPHTHALCSANWRKKPVEFGHYFYALARSINISFKKYTIIFKIQTA